MTIAYIYFSIDNRRKKLLLLYFVRMVSTYVDTVLTKIPLNTCEKINKKRKKRKLLSFLDQNTDASQ
jgi:hypothetical protein